MKFIVSCVKHSSGLCLGVNASEDFIHLKKLGGNRLNLLDAIDTENGNVYHIEKETYDELCSRIEKSIRQSIKNKRAVGIQEAETITEKMWSGITDAASLLLKKVSLGIPVIIRFHNDSDGSSGAYAIYKGLSQFSNSNNVSIEEQNIVWIMQRGVSYSESDYILDKLILNNYESVEKPLIVMVDFGTTIASNKGVKKIAELADIIWLDHHPIEKGFFGIKLKHYINPWMFGGSSDYTAGMLACALVDSFSNVDNREIEDASMIGDHSKYARHSKSGSRISMLLDLITSDSRLLKTSGSVTPHEIEAILADNKKMDELLSYANIKMEDMLYKATGSVKEHDYKKAMVCVSDFGRLRDSETKYPLPGRFSSRLFDELSKHYKKPCILILHSGNYISFRISKELDQYINILEVISEERKLHGDVIDSGGGHRNAASIKLVDDAYKGSVMKGLLDTLRSTLD